MKKNLALVLVFLMLLFTACASSGKEKGSSAGTSSKLPGTSDEPGGFSLLSNGAAIPVVYSEPFYKNEAERLAKAIRDTAELGGTVKVNTEERLPGTATDSGRIEILLGKVECGENEQAYSELKDYAQCLVKIVGSKLVIASHDPDSVTKAIDQLKLLMRKAWNGKSLCLDAAFECSYYAGTTMGKAKLPIAQGQELSIITESMDSRQVIFSKPSKAAFHDYAERLAASGYTLRSENMLEENCIKTYVNGACSVQLSYFPGIERLCLFVDPYKTVKRLPVTQEENGETYRPIYNSTLITQLGLYSNSEETSKQYTTDVCGMGYVIRLKDGRFIVVDGGFGQADDAQTAARGAYLESEEYRNSKENKSFEDADRIYKVMKKQTPDGAEPVIAAWFFTHADPDHVGAFVKFAERYHGTVQIGQLIYNFPDSKTLSGGIGVQVESAIRQFYPTVPTVNAHAGQVSHIANVTVQMLFTLELAEPNIRNAKFNDTSLVFRIQTDDGNSLLILGDCYPVETALIDRMYTGAALKSDIVQVAHHGIEGTGHGDHVYEKTAASYALWPAGAWYYAGYPCTLVWPAPKDKDMRNAPHNQWIVQNIPEEKIYLAGSGIQTVEMGQNGISITVYASLSEYLAGKASGGDTQSDSM